jgi:ribokinase
VGRVVVVGSANVDLVWQGARLPAPGETVTDGQFAETLGGKGANQAAAAKELGADVRFVGCVGDDTRGWAVVGDLEARGIDCTFVSTSTEPTGVALVAVDATGENMVAVAPGANRALAPEAAVDAIEPGDVVLCSCEIPLATVQATVTAAIERGAAVIVNPAPPRGVIPGAILTPNEHECTHLGGIDVLVAAAPAVIVTLGRDGATLHRAGHAPHHQPPFAIDAVDSTGAGDAFNGALAWALLTGHTVPDAARFACAAGALATRALGARASLATADEVYALCSS